MKTYSLSDALTTLLLNKQTIVSSAARGNAHPTVYVRGVCVQLALDFGICCAVQDIVTAVLGEEHMHTYMNQLHDTLVEMFGEDGSAVPVPHPTLGNYVAFLELDCTEFWDDTQSEYAACRWTLLDRLIANTQHL
ncbi:hypothetical protein NVP1077O_64 [Vibrio phage 1.077.O._10N.261.45.A10]|nr:hypothetical protein NVP1077O_64 [Vibrio phage 1.077.O._10N.261.45.A10]